MMTAAVEVFTGDKTDNINTFTATHFFIIIKETVSTSLLSFSRLSLRVIHMIVTLPDLFWHFSGM